ncbi:ammonium transporter [Pelomonas sp. Root662]|nr:ammonium transporter [Pelomonas sp. Root405]KRA70313.1 ammonium transporter [Pelomonas sp. Root662]
MIAMALGLTLARKLGYVDGDTVKRVVIAMNGLMIAWYGNRMPKRFFPNELARKVSRLGGWCMTVSGLVYVALWAFAPIPVAVAVGSAVVLAGIAAPVAYCVSQRNRFRKVG